MKQSAVARGCCGAMGPTHRLLPLHLSAPLLSKLRQIQQRSTQCLVSGTVPFLNFTLRNRLSQEVLLVPALLIFQTMQALQVRTTTTTATTITTTITTTTATATTLVHTATTATLRCRVRHQPTHC